jgi:ActR/RegA family two-component response regulator
MGEVSREESARRRTWPDRSPFRPGRMPAVFGDTAAALIVDDDEQMAASMARLLTLDGYRCTSASNAAEARTQLRTREFAVAVVDVLLPDGSGIDLVKAMLGEQPDLAVVMVSGLDDPSVTDLALQTGAYGYVVKPFRSSQVSVTVANASSRRCLEIERREHLDRVEWLMVEQATNLHDARIQLEALHRQEIISIAESAAANNRSSDRERIEGERHQSAELDGVAHDFNNLLSVIVNYTAFVSDEVNLAAGGDPSRDWSTVQQDVAQIQRAADRATQLTHRLTLFAHPSAA